MNKRLLLSVWLLVCASTLRMKAADTNSGPHSLPALQTAIESVLKETKTPGAAIAIVISNKLDWLAGIGKADVAANQSVTPDTLFRLGSVSKGFVALAALQLQEAGKLKLTDTVRQWVPDVAFVNPWEATNPVRLEHLMEHTSGFDDMHLREYALDDPAMTLDAALAYGASSRVCRWPPGERWAYCNSGPAVLAAVIEKVSGEHFEDYVQTNIFNPLHMDGASYSYTPEVQRRLAKLYRPDGVTAYPYWHVGLRPTAGLNASARDMANYLRFYLQRGSLDATQLLSSSSIERMERGETLPSAKLGRMVEYGLFNYDIPYGPFVFHGHNGAVMGGIVEMGYLPEQGCGYVVMINSGSFIAASRITDHIREYLRPKLTAPPLPPVVPVPDQLKRHYAGYYQYISSQFGSAVVPRHQPMAQCQNAHRHHQRFCCQLPRLPPTSRAAGDGTVVSRRGRLFGYHRFAARHGRAHLDSMQPGNFRADSGGGILGAVGRHRPDWHGGGEFAGDGPDLDREKVAGQIAQSRAVVGAFPAAGERGAAGGVCGAALLRISRDSVRQIH